MAYSWCCHDFSISIFSTFFHCQFTYSLIACTYTERGKTKTHTHSVHSMSRYRTNRKIRHSIWNVIFVSSFGSLDQGYTYGNGSTAFGFQCVYSSQIVDNGQIAISPGIGKYMNGLFRHGMIYGRIFIKFTAFKFWAIFCSHLFFLRLILSRWLYLVAFCFAIAYAWSQCLFTVVIYYMNRFLPSKSLFILILSHFLCPVVLVINPDFRFIFQTDSFDFYGFIFFNGLKSHITCETNTLANNGTCIHLFIQHSMLKYDIIPPHEKWIVEKENAQFILDNHFDNGKFSLKIKNHFTLERWQRICWNIIMGWKIYGKFSFALESFTKNVDTRATSSFSDARKLLEVSRIVFS